MLVFVNGYGLWMHGNIALRSWKITRYARRTQCRPRNWRSLLLELLMTRFVHIMSGGTWSSIHFFSFLSLCTQLTLYKECMPSLHNPYPATETNMSIILCQSIIFTMVRINFARVASVSSNIWLQLKVYRFWWLPSPISLYLNSRSSYPW